MKKSKKHFFIIAVVILLIVIMYLPTIQAHLKKSSYDNNKEVITETKVLSSDEFSTIIYKQMKLAQRLESSEKYSLVAEEVREGLDKAFYTFYFIEKHPEYELLEVEYPITSYKDSDKILEFISGKVIITKVHSENGEWKDYKGNQ